MYDEELLLQIGTISWYCNCNIGRGPKCFQSLVMTGLFNKDVLELNSIPE